VGHLEVRRSSALWSVGNNRQHAAGGLRAEAHSDVRDGEAAAENEGAKDRLDVNVLEVGEFSIDRQDEKIEGWRKEMQVLCVVSQVGDR
jgi:hypothetical protein